MKEIVASLRGTSSVVVGDVMLDRYVWGQAERISPEAPVPVLRILGRSARPGGAANAATNIVALGGTAALGGVIGHDAGGDDLRAAIADAQVDVSGLVVESGRPTTVKTRYYAQGQQLLRADVEEAVPIPPRCEETLLEFVTGQTVDVVVISDYAKGVVSPTLAPAVIGTAKRAGVPVVVDPKGRGYEKYGGASLVTPNQRELSDALNCDIATDDEVVDAGRRLRDFLGGETAVLVTRGPAGMTLVDGAQVVHIATASTAVYDVTGAGDTVLATVALALGAGIDLPIAARLANRAAAIAVARVGAAAVTADELAAVASQD
jgi:D-beta-D-heptose 7-phosphate kinase/D-beta-D-heptose 1-phosphate adenosyltransferase